MKQVEQNYNYERATTQKENAERKAKAEQIYKRKMKMMKDIER